MYVCMYVCSGGTGRSHVLVETKPDPDPGSRFSCFWFLVFVFVGVGVLCYSRDCGMWDDLGLDILGYVT